MRGMHITVIYLRQRNTFHYHRCFFIGRRYFAAVGIFFSRVDIFFQVAFTIAVQLRLVLVDTKDIRDKVLIKFEGDILHDIPRRNTEHQQCKTNGKKPPHKGESKD